MDPLKYALHFYRPPMNEQLEWGFPVDHETLHFDNPPKETQAAMKALEKYPPNILYSLHNMAFGGAYYNLYPRVEGVFFPLQKIITDHGLTLIQGHNENPYSEKWAEGIFQAPTVKAEYCFYKTNLGDTDRITWGANMSEYLASFKPDHISLMAEMPYFTSLALQNSDPSGKPLRAVTLEGAEARRTIVAEMKKQYEGLGMISDGRLKRAVEARLTFMTNKIDAAVSEAQNPEYSGKYDRSASIAEAYGEIQCNSFYDAIQLGQVYQLALQERERAVQAGEISKAELMDIKADEIKGYIESVVDRINNVSPIQVLPLQGLVKAQVAAGLETMTHRH